MATSRLMSLIDRSALSLAAFATSCPRPPTLHSIVVQPSAVPLMSLHFSANQFDDAYAPHRLSNWQIPRNFPERPRARHGATRTIADDNGHFVNHTAHATGNHKGNRLRFQSAPVPASNQLFISGSAVATTKPAKTAKVNLGQRTTQPTEAASGRKVTSQYHEEQEDGDDEEVPGNADEDDEPLEPEVFHLAPSALPDNPRKAAAVLAARQKNHRPLPDLMLESADALIPRNWNHPEAAAVTVETTKAKGPTSCTKRTVLRLRNECTEPGIERKPNVMELAIKWDVRSPPASAGTRKKTEALSAARRPVEKTLDWLYEQVPKSRQTEKEQRNQTSGKDVRNQQAIKQESRDSQYNSRNGSVGSTTYGRTAPCLMEKLGEPARHESDPESGYNSPRSDGEHNKTPLADLDDVKAVYRSTASSATPPKNHFLVSTTGYKNQGEAGMLPEYPLQRRSPVQPERHYSKPMPVEPNKSQQAMASSCPVNEYPPQRAESITSDYRGQTTAMKATSNQQQVPIYEDDDRSQSQSQSHQYDGDSGVGDLQEEEYDDDGDGLRGRAQAPHNRSRPCLACESPSNSKTRANNAATASRGKLKTHGKTPFKLAMKAGVPATKNPTDLEKVTQRRQSYRAPKPAPLSSHARHIRDFKRLESTYRLSYGAHHNPQRRRQKTLTALLNEKNCRQWRS